MSSKDSGEKDNPLAFYSSLAQLVERRTVNAFVTGSSPVGRVCIMIYCSGLTNPIES